MPLADNHLELDPAYIRPTVRVYVRDHTVSGALAGSIPLTRRVLGHNRFTPSVPATRLPHRSTHPASSQR